MNALCLTVGITIVIGTFPQHTNNYYTLVKVFKSAATSFRVNAEGAVVLPELLTALAQQKPVDRHPAANL